MTGLIHIYTGDGKGKTTAAVGLGIRAAGHDLDVLFIQFLKGRPTGELNILSQIERFEIKRGGDIKKFVNQMDKHELIEAAADCRALFEYARCAAKKKDLIILDEVMAALNYNFIDEQELTCFLKEKPAALEIVMTGRDAPAALTNLADYVMEINPLKHPYEQGVSARRGIEY